MDDKDTLLLVLITAPEMETALNLARALTNAKIAACVNISPNLLSIYPWKGSLQQDEEVLLLVKTREGLLASHLIPLINQLHPYDLPEIIALPIVSGSQAYLKWLRQETGENLKDC